MGTDKRPVALVTAPPAVSAPIPRKKLMSGPILQPRGPVNSRQAGYLVIGAVLVIAGTIAITSWMLFDARRDAWNQAVSTSTNLATAFERDITRNIDLYDLSLKAAIANRNLPNVWSFDPAIRNQIIFGGATSAPYLGAMRLLDANGRMIAESGTTTPSGLDFGDRDYFRVQRDRRDVGLYISAPLKGRETGEWMVAFSRRIEGPDGAFAGVAVGTMRLAYFRQLFDSVDTGAESTIALFRGDGTYVVRKPFADDLVGRSAGADLAPLFLGWSQGNTQAVSPVDDVRRLYTYRQIGDRPLAIRIGLSERVIFADWREKVSTVIFSVAALIILAGVFGLLFAEELRRRTHAERLLAASEQHLRQSQQMEAIGRLAGGIAHDFNNILSSILGFGRFLVQDLPEGSTERTFAERIVKAGERAKTLVHQILTFSRRSGVERTPLNLAGIVLETRDLLRATLPQSTRLEVEVKADDLIVEANAAQINQILLNLCINANDALLAEEGTIRLAVSRLEPGEADRVLYGGGAAAREPAGSLANGRALLGALDANRPYAVLTVTDPGAGMTPEILQHIFDPFFTTKERGRGTGLGLSVVHGIVLDYGGACMVTSKPGGGTVFNVYLALSDRTVTAEPVAAVRRRGRESIMVIDDEPDVAETLTIGLKRLGYDVTMVTNPQKALETFAADPAAWDIVISDQAMPGLNGLVLFARLKAMRSSLRFILYTGFSDGASEEASLAQGVDAYFLKPVSIDELAATIRGLVDEPLGRALTG